MHPLRRVEFAMERPIASGVHRDLGRTTDVERDDRVPHGEFDGAALLLSLTPGRSLDEATKALIAAGASVRATALVGGHATRYTV